MHLMCGNAIVPLCPACQTPEFERAVLALQRNVLRLERALDRADPLMRFRVRR